MKKVKDVQNYGNAWSKFLDFHTLITGRGMNFRPISGNEMSRDFEKYNLRAPRKLTGREVGYILTAPNGNSVKVWTTIVKDQKRPRDKGEDVGWVIIVDAQNNLVYCARYFNRPKNDDYENFFLNLIRYAWVSRVKILNPPLCRHGHERPVEAKIERKRGSRQMRFVCRDKKAHPKPVFFSWDEPIKYMPKAIDFVKIRRKKTAQRKKRNKELGINPVPKATKRRTWQK